MKYLILLATLSLAACNSGGETPSEKPRTPEKVTDSGVWVYVEKPEYTIPDRTQIEKWYTQAADCLGFENLGEPPIVNVVKAVDFAPDDNSAGIRYGEINEIYIKYISSWYGHVWRHEFIHHILDQNGIHDSNHNDPVVWECQWNDV